PAELNADWQPAAPSALERALRSAAGWPSLIAPFLVQNIGWFIGGLCFVAGSIFLVSYTAGFFRALAVCAVVPGYTAAIIPAGDKLRLRRPELETSSNVLMILGVLLVPLDIAASARLIAAAAGAPSLALGILVAVAGVAGFSFAVSLVSGVID